MDSKRKIPTLVELCTQVAIDNIRYIGDVSGLDFNLLESFLPHCNVKQLAHIENSTQGSDLSPVTDSLWKRFYESEFGEESINVVIRRMKQKQVRFKWKQLYEAKTKEREEAQKRMGEKLKQRYAESLAQKQNRQIKICSKVPPSSNKRSFWGGGSSNMTNYKSPIMKKAKIEFLNSPQAKVPASMKRGSFQQSSTVSKSLSNQVRPSNVPRSNPTTKPIRK